MTDFPEMSGHATLSAAAGLSAGANRVYAFAVSRPSFHPAELTDLFGMTARDAAQAVAELEELGLVQPALSRRGELTCVSPDSAADVLLAPLEREIREKRALIGRMRAGLLSLVPDYEAGVATRRRSQAVEVVTDLDAVRKIIDEAARMCVSEVLASQPGGARSVEVLEDAAPRDEELLRRGVELRTIYQHTARYDGPTAAYVERMTALGAQVRTLGDGLMRMIVFDRRIGIMEVRGDRGSAVVVREPNIVDFMGAAFDRAWTTAEPFPASRARSGVRTVTNELSELITALLAEGRDDRAIARRLGMSERTCQRYVREILARTGARTRFQAGYLISAAQAGPREAAGQPAAAPLGKIVPIGHG